MQTNFTFIKKEDYLFLNLTGKYNLQDYFSIIEFAKNKCDAENINKILANTLDVEFTIISTMDRYDLGKKIAETLQYKIKIAFVAKKEIVDGFGQTVAINRGAIGKIFSDLEIAEKWLITKPD